MFHLQLTIRWSLGLIIAVLPLQSALAVQPKVGAGNEHSLALRSDGSLWAWGSNSYRQLGDGTDIQSLVPKQIGTGYMAVSASSVHSVALKSDGSIWAWGINNYGQLGDGTTINSSVPNQVGSGYIAVSAGLDHTVAIKSDGSLWSWGYNYWGALGDGTTINSSVPKQIGTGYIAVSAGQFHTVALKTDGSLWAWGYNNYGQLGDGTLSNSLSPKQVGTGYIAVSTYNYHTVALKTNGSLWTWGKNVWGVLGDGTIYDSLVPKQIGTGYMAVSAGYIHTAALKSDGSLWTWGNNSYGELGDGTISPIIYSSVPKQIGTGYIAVSAGGNHNIAIKFDGSIWVWGDNTRGESGDGTRTNTLVPEQVLPAIQVVEFYNTNLDNYFITADSSEAAQIDGGSAGPGWSRTGNSFKSGGSTSVCRFYGSFSPGPNSHFYTVDAGECQGLKDQQFPAGDPRKFTTKSWNFESLDFVSTPATNQTCPVGTLPVYRAYNNGYTRNVDSNHRITSSTTAIQEVVNRGWKNEGVVMCAPQ